MTYNVQTLWLEIFSMCDVLNCGLFAAYCLIFSIRSKEKGTLLNAFWLKPFRLTGDRQQ